MSALVKIISCNKRVGLGRTKEVLSSALAERAGLHIRGGSVSGGLAALRVKRLDVLRNHLQKIGTMAGNTEEIGTMAGNTEEENAIRAAAQNLAKQAEAGVPTIFDKILKKEIPCTPVYEDDEVLAFRDINPQAPTHIIIIPKHRDGLTQLSKAEERHKGILGHMLYVATVVAKSLGLSDGYRLVINDGLSGCQSVYHLHLHLLGGRQMKWPPG